MGVGCGSGTSERRAKEKISLSLAQPRLSFFFSSSAAGACVIPWYIMCSEATDAPTERFLEENDYFGLDKVFFAGVECDIAAG